MKPTSRLHLKIEEAIQSELHQTECKTQTDPADEHRLKAKMDQYRRYTAERKSVVKWIYRFMYLWCITVAILLVGCGIGKIRFSDVVLTTILACTSLNVVGFFYFATRYFLKTKTRRRDV